MDDTQAQVAQCRRFLTYDDALRYLTQMGYSQEQALQIIAAHFEYSVHMGRVPMEEMEERDTPPPCTLSEMERRYSVELMNRMYQQIADQYWRTQRQGGYRCTSVPLQGPATTFGPDLLRGMPGAPPQR